MTTLRNDQLILAQIHDPQGDLSTRELFPHTTDGASSLEVWDQDGTPTS